MDPSCKISSHYQDENPSKLALAANISAVAIAAAIPLSTSATSILFMVAVLLNILSGNLCSKFALIIHNKVALSLLAFFLLFIIGLTYSTASSYEAFYTLNKYDKLLLGALLFPLFIEKKWREYALNVFIFTMCFVLLSSYIKTGWAFYHHINFEDFSIFRRHISYNFLMSFFAYLIMLKISNIETKHRWLWIIVLILAIIDIFFMNISRTGYLQFMALVILFGVQKFNWKGVLAALCILLLIMGVAFTISTLFKVRIQQAVSDINAYHHKKEDTSVGARMAFVRNSVFLIKQHPIFGTGTGSYKCEYQNIKPTPQSLSHNPHNEYLHDMVQFGIVGLFALMLLFGSQLWYSRLLPGNLKYIAQAMIVIIMLGSFANSLILDTTEGHTYVYFIALTFASINFKRNKIHKLIN